MIQISNFRGDLSDISAETATLINGDSRTRATISEVFFKMKLTFFFGIL